MAAGSTAHPGKAARSGRTHRREFLGAGNEVSQAFRPGTRPVTRACTHKPKGVMYLAMSALRSEADTWAGLQRVCFVPIAGLHFLLPLLLPPNQIRPRRYVNFDLTGYSRPTSPFEVGWNARDTTYPFSAIFKKPSVAPRAQNFGLSAPIISLKVVLSGSELTELEKIR